MTITFTDAALTEANSLISKRDKKEDFIRLGVKSGGCNGFSYVVMYDNNFKEDRDILLVPGVQDETKLFVIDKKSMIYVDGSTIDYEKKLTENGFRIINPKEKSKCGCNKSFTV